MAQKILVVDDSIASQRLFEMVLTREGYDVVTIGSGTEVLDRLKEKRPDLALIDAIMPEVDGYQICKMLKNSPQFKNLPVILLAGKYEDFDQAKGAQVVKPDAILYKPSKSDEIIAKVKQQLAGVGQPQQAARTAQVKPLVKPTTVESKPIAVPEKLAEVVQEPPYVEEEYAFDEESEEVDRAVENEILDEEAELEEIQDEEERPLDEEHEEVSEQEESFSMESSEEETEEFVEETEEFAEEATEVRSTPATSTFSVEEQPTPAAPKAVVTGSALQQLRAKEFSEEKLDTIAEEIAQRVAGKLVPILMQELAAYIMQIPVVKNVIESTSKQLVKELLPEISNSLDSK